MQIIECSNSCRDDKNILLYIYDTIKFIELLYLSSIVKVQFFTFHLHKPAIRPTCILHAVKLTKLNKYRIYLKSLQWLNLWIHFNYNYFIYKRGMTREIIKANLRMFSTCTIFCVVVYEKQS